MTSLRFAPRTDVHPASARVSRSRARSWTGRAIVSRETETPLAPLANPHRTRVSDLRPLDRHDGALFARPLPVPVALCRAHAQRPLLVIEENG